jgi:hypothetical protein
MGDGLIDWLLVSMTLLVGCWVILEIKKDMGQCKSKEQDFKGYANAVFRCACCCLFASLSTETLRKLKKEHDTGQVWWDSASLRAKTLREIMLKKS